jgi:outer membrane protein, heavy metal efflux system
MPARCSALPNFLAWKNQMKAFLLTILLVGATLWFAGCAHYQARPIAPEKVATDFSSRTMTDDGLRAFAERNLGQSFSVWPLPAWNLTNLTLAAFYFHPDLDVARAKWATATAGKKTAGERPNPTLSVAPAYNMTTLSPSPWLVTATLDIPIETAGKRGYRLAQASQLSEVARLNIATVAMQVRSRVRNSLLGIYSARASEALLKEQQSLQDENVRLLEKQREAGAISAFELTQARLAADAGRLAVRDAERQSAEAQAQLADAVGVPLAALADLQFSFAELNDLPDEVPPAAARRQALLNRCDILGALAEYKASQAALQLEIAKQYPDVHLNPGYEFDQGDNKWSPGFSLTLPVLNQNQGPIAEAEARRAEAAASFNALQAHVIVDIERAVEIYRLALQKKTDTELLRAGLQKQEKAAQALLEAGEISRSELTALRLQLSASSLARLDAVTKSQQALAQLEDALQSPLGLPATLWQNPPRVRQP